MRPRKLKISQLHKRTEMRGKRLRLKENNRKNQSFWGVLSSVELNTNTQTWSVCPLLASLKSTYSWYFGCFAFCLAERVYASAGIAIWRNDLPAFGAVTEIWHCPQGVENVWKAFERPTCKCIKQRKRMTSTFTIFIEFVRHAYNN